MFSKNFEGKEFYSDNLELKINKILVVNGKENIYVCVKYSGIVKGIVVLCGFFVLFFDYKKLEI